MTDSFFLYFLKSYKVTFLVIVALAGLGLWTVFGLSRESTPEIKIPVGVVVTAWPGASARDVEELVTSPIEDRLLSLEGVKQVSSSSRVGLSSVTIEFEADEDVDEALRRLREEVDKEIDLPVEAEAPEVVEINFANQPIISLGMGGVADTRLLVLYAEDLAGRLEDINGVSRVDVVGGRKEEVQVLVDPEKLASRGVGLGQLLGVIRAADVNAPFGSLTTDKFNYDLRLVGEVESISDVADIPVVIGSGEVVPLANLAEVKLTLEDQRSLSLISLNGGESTAAVTLQVRKKTGGNIVQIIDLIEKEIEEARGDILPEEVQITTFADQADEIRSSLSNVTQSGAQTLLIVFGLLWLFLGWRAAVITALAVPLTFSISFLVFDQMDITLNNISLFSLILSLGLLVDNAIVIVEGIHSHNGSSFAERAETVVKQLKKPLIGGTLTTVAAFFPMLLVSGIIGQFLAVIPIVVTATLVSSLLVALAFIPPVAVALLERFGQGIAGHEQERWFDQVFTRFSGWYEGLLNKMLDKRKWQNWFIGGLAVLLIIGFSLPFSGWLKTGLFPVVDIDFLIINGELAPGSTLEEAGKVAAKVEEDLREIPEVESYVLNLGSSSSLDLGGGSSSEGLFSLFVNLNEERERTSIDITDELRGSFKEITEADVRVEEVSAGPPSAAPVEFRVLGDNLDELDALSLKLMDELRQVEGAIEVDRNLRRSAGEFNFVIDRELLAERGMNVADVAQALRVSVFGVEATSFLGEGDDEISVRVLAQEETVNAIDDVLALPIVNARGEVTRIGQVAKVDLSTAVDAIRHQDGEVAVAITARAAEGYNANEIAQEIEGRIKENNLLPEGFEVVFGGEQQETAETFAELYRSMIVAVLLILLILVVEFNSYRQPLLIFLSIPLGLIGVLFGLVILGGQLNFAAFIGLVSLTGIVVNNAIILVDRMNAQMAEGKTAKQAVAEAAHSRLRPIILTTITTAAGVAPLIWVDEFFRDMALTLITGLLFSAVLTLVLIPVLYLRQQQKMRG